jgi:hypothetical protein
MAVSDTYVPAAQAFARDFPIGSELTVGDFSQWAQRYSNGLATDLLIGDERKKVGSLARHINLGASSPYLGDVQFRLIVDNKIGLIEVVGLADYVNREAKGAIEKSAMAAIAPLERSTKATRNIPIDQLDEEMRAELETRKRELEAAAAPLRQTLVTMLTEAYVVRLVAQGHNEQDARKAIAMLPSLNRELRLLNRLRG